MDQFLENLPPELRAVAVTMRQIADDARNEWINGRPLSRAAHDTGDQEAPER